MNPELFVIVSAANGEPLWAAVTIQEVANQAAVRIAVNHGNCNLLSGRDLAAHLAKFLIIDSGTVSGSPVVGPFGEIAEAEAWIARVCDDTTNVNHASFDSFVIEACTSPAKREKEIVG